MSSVGDLDVLILISLESTLVSVKFFRGSTQSELFANNWQSKSHANCIVKLNKNLSSSIDGCKIVQNLVTTDYQQVIRI